MRLGALLSVALLCNAAHSRADESYPVSGRAFGGTFAGEVTLRDVAGGGVDVELSLGASGRTYAGRGTRDGSLVRATVQSTVGVSEVLASVGAPARADAGPLELAFQRNPEGTRWRVRLAGARGVIAAGEGELGGVDAPRPRTTQAAADRWLTVHGVPFVRAPEDPIDIDLSDPQQGQLGDCYFIAGMIALAHRRPQAIRSMFREVGGGECEITLRGAGTYLYVFPADARVRVDRQVPVSSDGKPSYAQLADTETRGGQLVYELWPIMLERAYAQHRGGYANMENGWPSTVFALAGLGVTRLPAESMDEGTLGQRLQEALRAGKPITVGFGRKDLGKEGIKAHVIGSHAYVITGTRDGAFSLRNPWGSSHPPRPITAGQLRAMGGVVEVGE